MFLKELTIKGFKSFLNTTKLDFFHGVTAIVGPNGSGKSNISDAIRWVLGETSIKTLRGNKMEDVIFTGTDDIKPVGFAEVEIKFSECELERFPYSEIVVSRRVYRDGESEYYINKNKVRLKDVRELFMDTGLGRDGYSIIGQGQIDNVLSTKPEDRRFIFEEASGISKFRYKREEALTKIKNANDDLDRLTDVYSEIKKNYERLKTESSKAKEYTELAIVKKDLELDLMYKNLIKNAEDRKKLIDSIEIYENDKKRENDNIVKLKEDSKEIEKKIDELSIVIDNVSKEKMEVIRSFTESKGNHRLEAENIKRLESDISTFKSTIETNLEKIEQYKTANKELAIILNSTDDGGLSSDEKEKRTELLEKLDAMSKNLEALRDKMMSENLSYNKSKIDFDSNKKREEFYDERIENLESSLEDLKSTLEISRKDFEDLCESLDKKHESLKELESTIGESRETLARMQKETQEFNRNKENLENKIRNYKYELALKNNILEQYQLSGFSNKKVNEKFKNDKGYLAEVTYNIDVDSKYTKAIETAFGAKLGYIITRTQNDAKEMVEFLKTNKFGRATFLPLELYNKPTNFKALKPDEDCLGYAADHVKTSPELENLIRSVLGPIVIFRDLKSATLKRREYNSSIVTLDGEFLHFSGSITGGEGKKEQITPLSIKNEIKALKTDLNANEEALKKLGDVEALINNFNSFKEKYDSSVRDYENYKIEFAKDQNEKNLMEDKLGAIEERKAGLLEELKKINAEKSSILIDEISDEAYNKSKTEYESYKSEFEKFKESADETLRELNEKENNIKLFLYKKENAQSRIDENNLQVKNLEIENENLKKTLEENKKMLEEKGEIKDSLFKSMTEFEEKEKLIDSKTNELYKERNELRAKFETLSIQEDSIRENITGINEKINSDNLKIARIDENLEIKKNDLLNEYNISYDEFIASERETASLRELTQNINEINSKIELMGPVNMSAIAGYKEALERKTFYEKQIADCKDSIDDLLSILKKINRDMKSQFNEAFVEIRNNFKYVFEELFNGGKADLTMTDPDDPLNTGIQIIAKPPGKKEQQLSLLSGGEKTLTAMALLFAFLKLKPSPFCILDEIDAALDDANIMRYTNFLRKLSEDSQFLIITHRKPTLEVADTIYGVCMRKKGISDIISMRIEEYEEE